MLPFTTWWTWSLASLLDDFYVGRIERPSFHRASCIWRRVAELGKEEHCALSPFLELRVRQIGGYNPLSSSSLTARSASDLVPLESHLVRHTVLTRVTSVR